MRFRRIWEMRSTRFRPGVDAGRHRWLILLVSLLFASACQPEATSPPATVTLPPATAAPTATTEPSPLPTDRPPTAAPTNTARPSATATAEPSDTPRPSATTRPSLTPTAITTAITTAPATAASPLPAATTASAQTIFNTPSVWNTSLAGPGVTAGGCSGTVNPPYGLVLITPRGDQLLWHNTVPEDYTFLKTGDTTYAYSGPTGIGDGTVTMQLTFSGAEALQMTRAFVPNAEPGCTHTHTYSGVFQFFRP
jgi:hypothetical protein